MKMLVYIMFLLGFFFFYNCNYLILMLLVLEFIFVGLYYGLFISLIVCYCEQYFMMIYLVFMVCESVLGLSLMLMIVRFYGSDYFQALNVLW
uniref:NADH-ubiquinone oxidoreductase chain 4L n=1 Tax=Mastinocerus sp. MAS01 TaxID=1205632 RepID=A0A0S2MP53_9COLE|nr:NADH deshydrogenase subunit 4L [Mastinocerus sp. MAS01]